MYILLGIISGFLVAVAANIFDVSIIPLLITSTIGYASGLFMATQYPLRKSI